MFCYRKIIQTNIRKFSIYLILKIKQIDNNVKNTPNKLFLKFTS